MITNEVDDRVAEITKLRRLDVRLRAFITVREEPLLEAMKVYAALKNLGDYTPCTDCEPVGVHVAGSDPELLYSEWTCASHCFSEGEGWYVPIAWMRVYLAGALET